MFNCNVDPNRFVPLLASTGAIDPLAPSLVLAREGSLSVSWSAFDHTPTSAKLAVVGITPGRKQAANALIAFRDACRAGRAVPEALRLAKLHASFSGRQTRTNIVRMLDHIGLHRRFGLSSCASLFDAAEHVHFTSALRYPVFVDGANYNGSPSILGTRLLIGMVENLLAAEVRALPQAVWLPLGPKPEAALKHLVSLGVLAPDRLLEGMPHPSGANGERVLYFLGRKPKHQLSRKTRPEMLGAARERLLAQVAQLGSA